MSGVEPADPGDLLALRALAERYASAVDRRDRALLLGVFAPDARLSIHNPSEVEQPTSVLAGHEQIGAITERIGRYDRTFHLLGNSRYDVMGDTARGEVYCVAHHLGRAEDGAGDDTDDVMYIRYQDECRRLDAGWLIVDRCLRVDWTDRRTVGRRD